MAQKQSRAGVPLRRFTDAEDKIIDECMKRAQTMTAGAIAAAEKLGRTIGSVEGRYYWLRMPQFQRDQRVARIRKYRRMKNA